jgi:surface antigen
VKEKVMRLFGMLLAAGMVALLAMALLVTVLTTQPVPSTIEGYGDPAVVQAALTMQAHLSGPRATLYGRDFPQAVIASWNAICHGCTEMQSGSLQCVMFVLGAYALTGQPLHTWGNAIDFWTLYHQQPGWREVPAGRGLPLPGDVLVWQGGAFGHVAIVTSVFPPTSTQNGRVTVAEANAPGHRFPGSALPGNWYTMLVPPDLSFVTWPGYRVLGYLHPKISLSDGAGELPPGLSLTQPYVQMAWDDAVAFGLPPGYFVRQINQESGFAPAARSAAGAEGIAQFLPQTAARLGVNPFDPASALHSAAQLMVSLVQ